MKRERQKVRDTLRQRESKRYPETKTERERDPETKRGRNYLHNIKGTEFHPASFLGAVDLCATYDDSVSRQVDTPG